MTVGRVVVSVQPFTDDTDNNHFRDTFMVTVYLFAEDPGYAIPLHLPGSFRFDLSDDREQQVASWELLSDTVKRAEMVQMPGPGYLFQLNINDVASDKVLATVGALACEFTPVEGESVGLRGGSPSVMIGPTGFGMGRR